MVASADKPSSRTSRDRGLVMTKLSVQFSAAYPANVGDSIVDELSSWEIYHDDCGMGRVNAAVHNGYANFDCRGCGWSEAAPLATGDPTVDRHNVAALQRLAADGEAQTLRIHSAMGGLMGLVMGALLGEALRVDISPLDDHRGP